MIHRYVNTSMTDKTLGAGCSVDEGALEPRVAFLFGKKTGEKGSDPFSPVVHFSVQLPLQAVVVVTGTEVVIGGVRLAGVIQVIAVEEERTEQVHRVGEVEVP